MKSMILRFSICLLITLNGYAQILHPVKWSYAIKKTSDNEAIVLLKATIEDGWHLYSQTIAQGGPIKTSIAFRPGKNYVLLGTTSEPKPISRLEKAFNMQVSYFEHEVIFQQRIRIRSGGFKSLKGNVEYMTCNDQKCLPPETLAFEIPYIEHH